tara:strand:+ start:72 stop:458 length:387 start_codon:yes stop_codon:yes gene_type:complete
MAKREKKIDGYQGKVDFWEDQLALAKEGEGRYPLERCEESLAYFKGKRADYIAKHGETTDADVESAKERAIRKCKERFEGLSEAERMMLANKIIKDASNVGITVNQSMAFLKDAEVMSDTELVHSVTF